MLLVQLLCLLVTLSSYNALDKPEKELKREKRPGGPIPQQGRTIDRGTGKLKKGNNSHEEGIFLNGADKNPTGKPDHRNSTTVDLNKARGHNKNKTRPDAHTGDSGSHDTNKKVKFGENTVRPHAITGGAGSHDADQTHRPGDKYTIKPHAGTGGTESHDTDHTHRLGEKYTKKPRGHTGKSGSHDIDQTHRPDEKHTINPGRTKGGSGSHDTDHTDRLGAKYTKKPHSTGGSGSHDIDDRKKLVEKHTKKPHVRNGDSGSHGTDHTERFGKKYTMRPSAPTDNTGFHGTERTPKAGKKNLTSALVSEESSHSESSEHTTTRGHKKPRRPRLDIFAKTKGGPGGVNGSEEPQELQVNKVNKNQVQLTSKVGKTPVVEIEMLPGKGNKTGDRIKETIHFKHPTSGELNHLDQVFNNGDSGDNSYRRMRGDQRADMENGFDGLEAGHGGSSKHQGHWDSYEHERKMYGSYEHGRKGHHESTRTGKTGSGESSNKSNLSDRGRHRNATVDSGGHSEASHSKESKESDKDKAIDIDALQIPIRLAKASQEKTAETTHEVDKAHSDQLSASLEGSHGKKPHHSGGDSKRKSKNLSGSMGQSRGESDEISQSTSDSHGSKEDLDDSKQRIEMGSRRYDDKAGRKEKTSESSEDKEKSSFEPDVPAVRRPHEKSSQAKIEKSLGTDKDNTSHGESKSAESGSHEEDNKSNQESEESSEENEESSHHSQETHEESDQSGHKPHKYVTRLRETAATASPERHHTTHGRMTRPNKAGRNEESSESEASMSHETVSKEDESSARSEMKSEESSSKDESRNIEMTPISRISKTAATTSPERHHTTHGRMTRPNKAGRNEESSESEASLSHEKASKEDESSARSEIKSEESSANDKSRSIEMTPTELTTDHLTHAPTRYRSTDRNNKPMHDDFLGHTLTTEAMPDQFKRGDEDSGDLKETDLKKKKKNKKPKPAKNETVRRQSDEESSSIESKEEQEKSHESQEQSDESGHKKAPYSTVTVATKRTTPKRHRTRYSPLTTPAKASRSQISAESESNEKSSRTEEVSSHSESASNQKSGSHEMTPVYLTTDSLSNPPKQHHRTKPGHKPMYDEFRNQTLTTAKMPDQFRPGDEGSGDMKEKDLKEKKKKPKKHEKKPKNKTARRESTSEESEEADEESKASHEQSSQSGDETEHFTTKPLHIEATTPFHHSKSKEEKSSKGSTEKPLKSKNRSSRKEESESESQEKTHGSAEEDQTGSPETTFKATTERSKEETAMGKSHSKEARREDVESKSGEESEQDEEELSESFEATDSENEACYSKGKWFKHGSKASGDNFMFKCDDGTLKKIACFKGNHVIRKGRTVKVQKKAYTCQPSNNECDDLQLRTADPKGGSCSIGEGEKLKLGAELKMKGYVYKCTEKGLKRTACIFGKSILKPDQKTAAGGKTYACLPTEDGYDVHLVIVDKDGEKTFGDKAKGNTTKDAKSASDSTEATKVGDNSTEGGKSPEVNCLFKVHGQKIGSNISCGSSIYRLEGDGVLELVPVACDIHGTEIQPGEKHKFMGRSFECKKRDDGTLETVFITSKHKEGSRNRAGRKSPESTEVSRDKSDHKNPAYHQLQNLLTFDGAKKPKEKTKGHTNQPATKKVSAGTDHPSREAESHETSHAPSNTEASRDRSDSHAKVTGLPKKDTSHHGKVINTKAARKGSEDSSSHEKPTKQPQTDVNTHQVSGATAGTAASRDKSASDKTITANPHSKPTSHQKVSPTKSARHHSDSKSAEPTYGATTTKKDPNTSSKQTKRPRNGHNGIAKTTNNLNKG